MASEAFQAQVETQVRALYNYHRHPASFTFYFAADAEIGVAGLERRTPEDSNPQYGSAQDSILLCREGQDPERVLFEVFYWEPVRAWELERNPHAGMAGRMFPIAVAPDGNSFTYALRKDKKGEAKTFRYDVATGQSTPE